MYETTQNVTPQPHTLPVVSCQVCKLPMEPIVAEAGTNSLHTITYHCERCRAETERTFKRVGKHPDHSHSERTVARR